MTHTPGPWKAYQKQGTQGQGLPQWRIHGPGVTGSVATVDFDLIQPTITKQNENASSNARLIAAAPELLEALKDCIEWLDRTGESVSEGGKEYEYVTKAREAITKAKGKE